MVEQLVLNERIFELVRGLGRWKAERFKFYRPNQYKEAPKKELTEEEKILAASGRSDLIATAAPELIAGTTQTAMTYVYIF